MTVHEHVNRENPSAASAHGVDDRVATALAAMACSGESGGDPAERGEPLTFVRREQRAAGIK